LLHPRTRGDVETTEIPLTVKARAATCVALLALGLSSVAIVRALLAGRVNFLTLELGGTELSVTLAVAWLVLALASLTLTSREATTKVRLSWVAWGGLCLGSSAALNLGTHDAWAWIENIQLPALLLLATPLLVPAELGVILSVTGALLVAPLALQLGYGLLHGQAPENLVHELVGSIPLSSWGAASIGLVAYVPALIGWLEFDRARQSVALVLGREETDAGALATAPLLHGSIKRPALVQIGRSLPSSTLAAFERDARLACRLRSTNVALMFEFGVDEQGRAYCVRERIAGTNLQRIVELSGVLLPERAINLLGQLCNALIEAHERGLPHGTLEPRKVLVTRRDGEFDLVRVTDFGLTQLMPQKEVGKDGERRLSARSDVAYVAPELLTGEQGPSVASDVYALGCIGYWLMAGRPPFIGEPDAVVRHALKTQAPQLAQLCELTPPNDLAQILQDCLAKNPTERIADAQTLRRRLQACNASSHWSQARAKAWWQTHSAALPSDKELEASELPRAAGSLFGWIEQLGD
jgi:serine/threonine-protein kinase